MISKSMKVVTINSSEEYKKKSLHICMENESAQNE